VAYVFTEGRVGSKARMRAAGNVGLAVGGGLGGIGLQTDSAQMLRWTLILVGAALIVSALIGSGLPSAGRRPVDPAGRRSYQGVFRDRPYMTVVVLNGLVCTHYGLFEVAMPLWIVTQTSAPKWLVGAVFTMNTVLVVLFQMRVSRDRDSAADGGRALRQAVALIALSTVAYAAAAYADQAVLAAFLIVAASTVYVFGEMLQATGSWALSYELTPDGRHGEYQGAFKTGSTGGTMLAPLVGVLVIGPGNGMGWIGAGVFLLAVGNAAALYVVRLARTGRGASDATSPAGC
jgi:hypothetical protein